VYESVKGVNKDGTDVVSLVGSSGVVVLMDAMVRSRCLRAIWLDGVRQVFPSGTLVVHHVCAL
jgi:hypothetical protein